MAISETVRAEVEPLRDALPEMVELTISGDDALFIEASIREVLKTLAFAVALVVAVILLFLASARAAVTPAVIIPISLLGACAGLWAAGFSINVLTLFALSRLAIGVVIIGGFALATALTLFLTPALYALLAPLTRPRGAVAARLDEFLDRFPARA